MCNPYDLIPVGKGQGDNHDPLSADTSQLAAGQFIEGNMQYEIDRANSKEPALAEMTAKALEVLSKDKDGFFLMVEGGAELTMLPTATI